MNTWRDPKGYYAALGLTPTATTEDIRKAFRKLAKTYHPDRNKTPYAKTQFQKINEAHDILRKPDKRKAYDLSAQAPQPPPSPSRPYAQPPPPAPIFLTTCSLCGVVTAQPRKTTLWTVYGLLFTTHRHALQGIFCRTCADKLALKASLKTWLLGWWSFPRGPFLAVDALVRNMLGGDQLPDENARLLAKQALAFAAQGQAMLARAVLDQAIRLVRSRSLLTELLHLQDSLGPGERQRIINRWKPTATWAFYIQLLPLLTLVGFIAYMLAHPLFLLWDTTPWTPSLSPNFQSVPALNEVWHVASESVDVYTGPTFLHPVLKKLPRFTSIRVARSGTEGGFVFVRTDPITLGYVDMNGLERGDGQIAWRKWCEQNTIVPTRSFLLQGNVHGLATLRFNNQLSENVVVKLISSAPHKKITFYVQGKDVIDVPFFEPGAYTVTYSTGENLSSPCMTFLENTRAYQLSKLVHLQADLTADPLGIRISYQLSGSQDEPQKVISMEEFLRK